MLALTVLILCPRPDARGADDKTPAQSLADGRSGVIHFESLTPSGYFQLARKETSRKSVIAGTLSVPPATTGRGPAMVISHGSGGIMEARELWWADQLTRMGIAAFVVDSFGPRNVGQTATDQSQLSTAVNVAAALAALKLLATHPRVDPARIGVLGFSKGGQVALYTALEPFREAVIADDTRFALHVAFYPYCSDWYLSERISRAPMLLLLGGQDDYTPAAPCRDYAGWFKSKGVDATVIVYPNAYHDFDSSRRPVFVRDLVTGKNCDGAIDLDRFTVAIRPTGEDITQRASTYLRNCLTRGATVGGDDEARRRAPEDVKGFVKRVLQPGG
jgi:dienelactone hydrolase